MKSLEAGKKSEFNNKHRRKVDKPMIFYLFDILSAIGLPSNALWNINPDFSPIDECNNGE